MLGGDPAFASHHLERADRGFVEVGDHWGRALAALSRFRLHLHAGSVALSIKAGRDALDRFQTLGDPWGIPWTTMWLGTATRMVGDLDEAKRLFSTAVAVSEQAYVRCYAHAELGNLAVLDGDHQVASWHHERCAELAPTTGVRDSLAVAANAAGFAARIRRDPQTAQMKHLRALAIYEELGAEIGKAQTICALAYAHHHLGQHRTAEQDFTTALQLAERIGRPDIMIVAIEGLANLVASDDPVSSAVLLGAARRIRRDTGIQLTLIEGHDTARTEDHLHIALGQEAFDKALTTGQQSAETVIKHVLANAPASPS